MFMEMIAAECWRGTLRENYISLNDVSTFF